MLNSVNPTGEQDLADSKKREEYGLEPLRPTYRGTSREEWESVKNGGYFESKVESGSVNSNDTHSTWVSDQKSFAEEYTKANEDGVLVEFKPEAIDKSGRESGQPNDDTGIRIARGLKLEDVQKVTDKDGNILYIVLYDASMPASTATPAPTAVEETKESLIEKRDNLLKEK